MKPSRHSLLFVACFVTHSALPLPASEPAAEADSSATTTQPANPHMWFVRVEIEITADGKVSAVKVIDQQRTVRLSAHDWQRSLDRHLGKIRMDHGARPPELCIKSVAPLWGRLQSEVLDIVTRRGFMILDESPRSTGYEKPPPSGL